MTSQMVRISPRWGIYKEKAEWEGGKVDYNYIIAAFTGRGTKSFCCILNGHRLWVTALLIMR